jgi:photosystem II stability/assembly factor-like uncharacterized protein
VSALWRNVPLWAKEEKMSKNIWLLGLVLCVVCFVKICSAEDLSWENISGEMVNVNTTWVNPDNPRVIYVGTDNGILKSNDAGGAWNIVARQKRLEKGYYRALAKLPSGNLYLGTTEGVLISKDDGRNWYKARGVLGHNFIQAISPDKNGKIYVLSEGTVYKLSPDTDAYEKIAWREYSKEDRPLEGDETNEQAPEPGFIRGLRYIAVDPAMPGHIYLVVGSSLRVSEDDGRSWTTLPGLPVVNIRSITVSAKSRIYAASDSRVFTYDSGAWKELDPQMAVNDIHAIVTDGQENIYLAAGEGLFISKTGDNDKLETKKDIDDGEPTIQQVHNAAIEYADANIEKIREWSRKAAKRALLPKVDISFDKDIDSTISSNTWGTYGNGTGMGKYYVGPDDRTNYRNNNYSVSLTWELGDLIWSDAQVSIDTRSRLLVELRNDILDEVTKIYFERRRVKAEMDNPALGDNKIAEKKIRVEELTALLDGFTNGYFSRQMIK